jgi:Ca2+-binding EF-hand superfamily protein
MDQNTIDMMFNMMDTNQDQKISFNEAYLFAQAQDNDNTSIRGAMSFYTKTEEVNMIFQSFDLNSDGFLSHAEVKTMLIYAYGSASDADATWFIDVCDSNNDNYISWYELYNAIQ